MSTTTITQEKNYSLKKAITLRAVSGKQQGKLTLCPVSQNGRYLGIPFTKDQDEDRIITPETTREIKDGCVFNPNNKIDSIDWEWVKENKEIALNKEDGYSEPAALFYVDDEEAENEKILLADDIEYNARTVVRQSSQAKKVEILTLLGFTTEHMTPQDIDLALIDVVKKSPKKILATEEDPFRKTRIFIKMLLDKQVIVKKDDMFKFGDVPLGTSEDALLLWIEDDKNKAYIVEFTKALRKKSPLPTKSVLEDVDLEELAGKPEEQNFDASLGKKASSPDEFSAPVGDNDDDKDEDPLA